MESLLDLQTTLPCSHGDLQRSCAEQKIQVACRVLEFGSADSSVVSMGGV